MRRRRQRAFREVRRARWDRKESRQSQKNAGRQRDAFGRAVAPLSYCAPANCAKDHSSSLRFQLRSAGRKLFLATRKLLNLCL